MSSIRSCVLTLALVAWASVAVAAPPPEAACNDWLQVPVPAADTGHAADACDAGLLYYGRDGSGGDRRAARHCAYLERGSGDGIIAHRTIFGGSGILMMLYANGEGVARDTALASRFACEYGGAPAEIRGRLQHLQRIADRGDTAPLDICDDITSGMMSGFCAYRDAEFAGVRRDREWARLQSDWTPAQLDAWQDLRRAADAYAHAVAGNEIDLGGTARGAFAVGAREALEIQLLEDVQRFERGDRPAQRAADLASADRSLNAVYRSVRARLQAGVAAHQYALFGTITADGVRDSQRAWLRYREAWVAFAATRWGDTPADAWRAWLTGSRTTALGAITGGP